MNRPHTPPTEIYPMLESLRSIKTTSLGFGHILHIITCNPRKRKRKKKPEGNQLIWRHIWTLWQLEYGQYREDLRHQIALLMTRDSVPLSQGRSPWDKKTSDLQPAPHTNLDGLNRSFEYGARIRKEPSSGGHEVSARQTRWALTQTNRQRPFAVRAMLPFSFSRKPSISR